MIDKITKYYKENVSAFSIVFKEMKLLYQILLVIIVSLYLSSYLFILKLLFYYYLGEGLQESFVSWIILLTLTCVLIFIVNYEAKRVLARKHRMRIKGFNWRTEEFENLQSRILIKYLQDKNLYTKEKLTMLIELVNKEVERRKIPSLITPTIFITLFVPIWVQSLNALFKDAKTSELAISFLAGTTVFLILVLISISITKWIFKEIVSFLWFSDMNSMRNLINKLEEILLQFEETDLDS